MKIAEWQRESYIDYPGKISSVIFVPGCNYNCGNCHNPELKKRNYEKNIEEQEILNYIDKRENWIEAIVISGGEPLMQFGLKDFAKKIKEKGLLIKLDTNGKNYFELGELRKENLIDYVAMDVKGPIFLYPSITGKDFIDERDDVGKGIAIVSNFPNYEFRTTIIPVIRENEKMSWLSSSEIAETAKLIYKWTGKNNLKYFLQRFKAVEKEQGNPCFLKKNLDEEFWETPTNHLENCLAEVKKIFPNAGIR